MQKLERKFGKYAIHNLMIYVIILYVIGWVIQIVNIEFYYRVLSLDVSAILYGQIWRIFTFIIMPPPGSSTIFMFFTLYLYYILGNNLEKVWGAFRFNVYFFMGVLLHVVAAFLIYFIFGVNWPLTTYYLNMSLFFAFATIYPDMQLYLFFVLPIKIKWLAILDGAYFIFTIFAGYSVYFLPNDMVFKLQDISLNLGIIALPEVATGALVSLLNFIIFFFMTRNFKKYSPSEIKRKRKYKSQVKQSINSGIKHKCDICGRTSESNPELTFRFCSKCSGNHEYCQEHLFSHQHIQ